MSKNKNHNTIYFLTTLSVYLGLVIVGASPQILAQAEFTQNSQTQRFEIRTKTNSVFSSLKLKSQFEHKDVLPWTFFGGSTFSNRVWSNQKAIQVAINVNAETISVNNQVFTVPMLPRASI